MDYDRLKQEAESGDPEAKYLYFKERERRGEISLPEVPKTHFRQCFRCGLELTDETSLSWGMGSRCRGYVGSLDSKTNPDLPVLRKLHAEFLDKMDYSFWEASIVIARLGEVLFKDKMTQADSKNFCRKILWALSFRLPENINNHLLKMIEALGYPLLVSVIKNEAVIGKASVEVGGTQLFLISPRPRSSVTTKLKESGGSFDWQKRAWKWSLRDAQKAACVIRDNFLNVGGLEESLEQLKNFQAEEVEVTHKFIEKNGPQERKSVSISSFLRRNTPEEIEICTPYNQDFVTDLKTQIPFRSGEVQVREWNPTEKLWVVRLPQYVEIAKNLITRYFLKENI